MKVLDLQCGAGHGFEGWFASESDYEQQRMDGRLECPLCGRADIVRLPSAPRLNLSGAKAPSREQPAASGVSPAPSAPPAALQEIAARVARVVQEIVSQTEDVGDRFPEEARRIHYGEAPPKGIRGQATPQQRAELLEEGIETIALPVPVVPKDRLQ